MRAKLLMGLESVDLGRHRLLLVAARAVQRARARDASAPLRSPWRDAISLDELRLAARNHAMPLEALRYPITPAGLHYLLIHYDIPAVDEATYRLEVDGLVATPLSLSLEDLRARPAVELAVTMECAGQRARAHRAARRQPAVAAGGRGHGALARDAAARRSCRRPA